jgi:Sulfotransferase domain
MELAASASKMTMATNYGTEQNTRGLHEKFPSLNSSVMPIFQDWKGPFWVDPLCPHPDVTVLTKTHCGGYCGDCLPIENADSFLSHCATGNELRGIYFEYDLTQVKVDRAVHLIRDPIDNIVARYHYHAKKVLHRNETELVKRYTYDSEGFANYCKDSLAVLLHRNEVPDDYPLDGKVIKELQDIPCFVDLFRYIQWHNLAFLTTQESLKIPTLVVHYEEYSNNLNKTLLSLLNFLELPLRGAPAEFVSGKSYHDYFSHDQRSKILHATKLLSSPTTWSYLERYF